MPHPPALPSDIFSPLPTPQEMAKWDAHTIKHCFIPEFTLMENAAREAFHVLRSLCNPGDRILVITGNGNNGGDGIALARHLCDAGYRALICHARTLGTVTGTVGDHVRAARAAEAPFEPLELRDNRLIVSALRQDIADSPHVVVDALLGTGLSGSLRERERDIIRLINRLGKQATVLALDIPSGLDALTGHPRPEAVYADHTVTFEAAKVGLCLPEAAPYVGTLHVRPIGIPRTVRECYPASFRLLTPPEPLFSPPSPFMHKGDAGRVLIIGGSQAFSGAPQLAALGALRAGAGLVTIACPSGLCGQVRETWPEIMALPLGTGTDWATDMIAPLCTAVAALQQKSAVILGPGLGRSPAASALVDAVLRLPHRPALVLDADGLFPLTPGSDLPGLLRAGDCITPHPGEAAAMLGLGTDEVQAARPAALRALTSQCEATVVLKGAGTLIGQKNEPVTLAPFAAPNLAVGGSGDVLAGVVAALLARTGNTHPAEALRAVCLGVYLHGKAGELLAEQYPQRGTLAREIAKAVARVAAGGELRPPPFLPKG